MEKEYVMQVAQIIKEQLVALTPMTVLMSWSIDEFAATLYRDLPAKTERGARYCPRAWLPEQRARLPDGRRLGRDVGGRASGDAG